MSTDPFQDLFDREIPRSASPSTTRATLDDLTPRFERARSRRRARVGAIAAFAVLGSTGGAAALGVGPVALGHRPATEFNNGLAGGNETEAPPETADPSVTTTTTVTTTVPTTIFPVVTVTTTLPEPTDSVEASGSTATVTGGDAKGSDDPGRSDTTSDNSSGDDKSADGDKSKGSDDGPDHDSDPADDPVPGPLTASANDGTVTVGIGANGLTLIDVTPGPGVSYQIETKPDKISVEFRDSQSGDELSTLKFKLVTEGATVNGVAVDGITVKVDDSPS